MLLQFRHQRCTREIGKIRRRAENEANPFLRTPAIESFQWITSNPAFNPAFNRARVLSNSQTLLFGRNLPEYR